MSPPPGETHELVELALTRLLALVGNCSPDAQPSQAVLTTTMELLQMHHKGAPGENVEARIEKIIERLEELDTAVNVGMMTPGRGARK